MTARTTEGNALLIAAVDGVSGLVDVLKGLHEAVSVPWSAFEQQARAAFEQARKAGASQEEAWMAVAPLLRALKLDLAGEQHYRRRYLRRGRARASR